MQAAIAAGVPVAGHFVRSLPDDQEWAFGGGKRFGRVRADFGTLRRRPGASYHALARALARA